MLAIAFNIFPAKRIAINAQEDSQSSDSVNRVVQRLPLHLFTGYRCHGGSGGSKEKAVLVAR